MKGILLLVILVGLLFYVNRSMSNRFAYKQGYADGMRYSIDFLVNKHGWVPGLPELDKESNKQ